MPLGLAFLGRNPILEGMNKTDFDKLQNLLDDQVSWPEYYTFKFIVKEEHKPHALSILEDHDIFEKPSRSGTYTSITSKKRFSSSTEVIEVYKQMIKVEGIISL